MAPVKLPFDRRAIPAAAVEGVWLADDGWPLRRIDWPQHDTARGSLLFLPGRGDHYEKYLETLDQFDRESWNVTAVDWRGQGGSGRLLADPHVGHIDDFATWIADLKAFWSHWKATTPAPHVVVAHSMGGHLVMRALSEKAVDPVAVAMSAPMLGIPTMGVSYAIHHAAVRFISKLGRSDRAAWKEGEKPGSPLNMRAKILTHDADRYADELFWWKSRSAVKLGPPSWHWVERAVASTRLLNRPGVMESIDTPILLMATTADKLVDTNRIIADSKRLPNAELLIFNDEAAHELLRESDAIRDRCMQAIDSFFQRQIAQS
jgi:lysophospholipase